MSNDIRIEIPLGIFKTIKETIAVYHENLAEGFGHGDASDTDGLRDMLKENDLDEFDRVEIQEMIEQNEALSFLNNMDQEHLFGAFQATRQYKKDSEPYHDDYVMEGYAYLDTYEFSLAECLHVEITNGEWIPPNQEVGGKYGVTIDRSIFTSDNLEELERHVFKFAMEEGFADMIREIASDE